MDKKTKESKEDVVTCTITFPVQKDYTGTNKVGITASVKGALELYKELIIEASKSISKDADKKLDDLLRQYAEFSIADRFGLVSLPVSREQYEDEFKPFV